MCFISFSSFLLSVIFLSQDLFWEIILHLFVISPYASLDCAVFKIFYIFDDLTVLKILVRCPVKMPLLPRFSDVYIIIRPHSGIIRRKTIAVKCHSHRIMSRVHPINMIYMVDLLVKQSEPGAFRFNSFHWYGPI